MADATSITTRLKMPLGRWLSAEITSSFVAAIKAAFPYGQIRVQIQNGGMVADSGKASAALGDKSTDMVVVCVAVTVGY